MKTNLFKRKKGRLDSSLFLRTFSLLALLVVGIGASWAQDVISTFSMPTENPSPAFDDAYILNDQGSVKYYAQGLKDGSGNHVTKVVNGQTYRKLQDNDIEKAHIKLQFASGTIMAGDVLSITCIHVYGTTEPTVGDDANANEIGYEMGGSGTVVSDRFTGTPLTLTHIITASEIIDNGDGNEYIRIGRMDWRQSAYGTITVTRPAGFTVTFAPNNADWGTVTATANGNPITSGASVASGTKVTFTATPKSGDYLTWGWDGDSKVYAQQIEMDVTKDVTVTHNFTPGIKINAYPNNGSLGSINISGGGKSGTNIHITPWAGPVTFTATPNAGSTFVGWYYDVDCTDLATDQQTLTYTNDDDIKISTGTMKLTGTGTINRWAKFEVAAPTFDPVINLSSLPGDKGSNVSWDNGVMSASGSSDNWIAVKNVAGHGSEYTGIRLTTQGKACRIIVRWGNSNDTQCIKVVDAAANPTTIYYSWSMLGVPAEKVGDITQIRFAGAVDWSYSADNKGVTTFSNASLVNVANPSSTTVADGDNLKFKLDTRYNFYTGFEHGNIEWTYKEVSDEDNHATIKTKSTSYNQIELFNSSDIKNYNGVRLDYKGKHFRVIVRTSGGNFIYTVPESAERTVSYLTWSDFKMSEGDISNITRVDIAGCSDHDTEETVELYGIWLHKMYKYLVETLENHEEDYTTPGGIGTLTYSDPSGVNVVFSGVNGASRHNGDGGCGGVVLDRETGTSLNLNVPSGYRISKVKVGLGSDTQYYDVSFNYGKSMPKGTASYIEYIKPEGDTNDGIRMAIRAAKDQTDPDHQCEKLHITYVTFEVAQEYINESRNIVTSGENRDYWLYVPKGVLDREATNVPVLFSLHGTNNDYDQWDSGVQDYRDIAKVENFIVVNPRGKQRNFPIFGANAARGWDSDGTYNNDVKFFEAIIDELARTYSINQERIYITGFSNGGMMTYQTAFTSKRFAGFAAVGGYPLNEFHLQHYGNGEWQGSHPVPFMHIHGSNDDVVTPELVNTIVDNMVYRNGCNLIPTTTSLSNATKYEYAATANGYPFIYYNVTGGTHTPVLTINETSSKNIIWDFLKTQTRMSQSNYDGRKRMEFNTGLDVAGFTPEAHGWKRDLNNQILWQYGEGSGYTSDIVTKAGGYKEGKNVYHSLQFGSGWHNMQFTSSSENSNTSTIWVKVKLERLGKLSANADGSVFTPEASTPKVIFEDEYNIGEVSFNFNDKDLGGSAVGEYRLTFEWRCSSDTDPAIAKAIKITNASIVNGTHADYGVRHIETPESGFEGFIPYEKRLIAQWNFDLCDGARFNRQSLETGWSADNESKTDGIITYTYTNSLKNAQLTYGNSAGTLIPIFAGLKFTADPNKVKVQVYVDGGAMQRIQLVLEPGVQITVPYVKNTFRNNKDNNGNTQTQYEDYNDCLHHINRDILYVSSSPDFFDAVQNDVMPYTNKTDNWQNNFMFHTGGLEIVKGAKYRIPSMQKANYCGEQDGPCTITIKQTVTINRIGVNRNMVGSFYTEYIPQYYKVNGEVTKTKPEPGMRYVASPYGSKVESEGYYGEYTKAIAMTFGGWTYNDNKYKIPVGDSGSKTITDSWGDLDVYHGAGQEGGQNYNIGKLDVTQVPLATDGFPVYSRMGDENFAYNENVNPTAKDKPFDNTALSYHDKNYGQFYLSTTDGGSYEYVENLTPWSLPCRGAFVKFEPTYPGVLNVHILQEANQTYYIADEFGKLVKTNIFTKTGTGQTVNNTNGHFSIGQKDNVKYTFDVYPGKSYYVFSNTASMGFTGFYFEPYVFMENGTDEIERYDVGIKTATLKSTGYTGPNDASLTWDNTMYTYTNQTSEQTPRTYRTDDPDPAKNGPYTDGDVEKSTIAQYIEKNEGKKNYQPITYDNRAVHVTCNREFTAGTWGTICLPYSMNHLQLEDVFGEGAKVVLMRDVQEAGKNGYDKTTINFIYHQNQDIIAGYPYLVYPTKDVENVTSNAYLAGGVPSIISINGVGQNTVTHPRTNSIAVSSKDYYKTNKSYNYDGLPCFEFKGNFTPEDLDENSYVIATNGKLTRLAKTQTAAPYRAYVKFIGEPAQSGNAKLRIQAMNIGGVNGEDEDAVAIEDILLESGIVGAKTNVYSVNGTLIRQNTDDLRGLPKGVYIVNGKKYLVK